MTIDKIWTLIGQYPLYTVTAIQREDRTQKIQSIYHTLEYLI